MDRFLTYLRIPSAYSNGLRGLRWSSTGDALEFTKGNTFAFPAEVFQFLEGFVSQRPLIHFGYIIHLLYILKNLKWNTPFLDRSDNILASAFDTALRPYRNAGVFCAVLCKDIPPVPDPPLTLSTHTFQLEVGASEPIFAEQQGEMPPLSPVIFEVHILRELSSYSSEEILHWFRHGRGSVNEAGTDIAQAVLLDKPLSLHGLLADLAQHQRLSGAVPFVEQLVSALTLPPRRLDQSELPLGGYSDVSTRGQVEQLLPSQFVFDDLEFVRRHAERELLYFRREDPHVHTREDLVVLLDQGVRTWGTVRLVLTAALFALGRLAEHRKLPFLISATSGDGELLDPLQAAVAELHELIEASDLSASPGAVLERVLSEETGSVRDIVLLTHPRNLAEPDVIAAARRLPAHTRLFAVAVDDRGEVEFCVIRNGAPVLLSRFHVDVQRTAPPPKKTLEDPLTMWRGDVEPVPYPFRFGLAIDQKPIHLAFDTAGDWLLVVTHGGILYATRTDGSRTEILPRGLVQNTIVADVAQVIGVAGGFVVVSQRPDQVLALHYDFPTRTCTAHSFTPPQTPGVTCCYLRSLHTLVVAGSSIQCIQLSTGTGLCPPAAFKNLVSHIGAYRLPIQGEGEPFSPNSLWCWPQLSFDPENGTIRLQNVLPAWEEFTPLEDNQPVLKGQKLERADCQGYTLAALFKNPTNWAVPAKLRLFRGPQGIPLASYLRSYDSHCFVLSNNGGLLAHQVGRGHVQIRDVSTSKSILHVLSAGRYHPRVQVHLGECWLSIRIDHTVHVAHWDQGILVLKSGQWNEQMVWTMLKEFGLPTQREPTFSKRLPTFLPNDPGRRFIWATWNNLVAVVDRFGEVAVFEATGELVCLFFAFRRQVAVWMPDGTCHGPMSLLGRPATPDALGKIGAALRAARERDERTVV